MRIFTASVAYGDFQLQPKRKCGINVSYRDLDPISCHGSSPIERSRGSPIETLKKLQNEEMQQGREILLSDVVHTSCHLGFEV